MRYILFFVIFCLSACNIKDDCNDMNTRYKNFQGFMMSVPDGESFIKINEKLYNLSLHEGVSYRDDFGSKIDQTAKMSNLGYHYSLLHMIAEIYFSKNGAGKCQFHLRNIVNLRIINDKEIFSKQHKKMLNENPF